MPNETLAERIGSAYDAQMSDDSGESTGGQSTETTSETPAISPIGVETGSPSQGNGENTSAEQVAWQLAENVRPDMVVGMINGKPVTAAEIKDGYMRTQDYTAKTTEIARQREEAQQYINWYKQNETYIQGLNSPNPEDKRATLLRLAEDFGIDLGSQRARDEQGRFAAQQEQQGQDDLYNLEDFERGSDEYDAALRWNQQVQANRSLRAELDELKNTFQSFTSNVTTQVEMQERMAQATEIATQWSQSGLEGVDVQGAMSLVGKPIDIATAMKLHHWDKVLRHNYNAARGHQPVQAHVPNEPAGGAITTPEGSLRGKSLSQSILERGR